MTSLFTTVLGSPRWVLAPLGDSSTLPFRLLCRRHGAELCYTGLLHAEAFAKSESYRHIHLPLNPLDRPLIAQFGADDPDALLRAASLAKPHCDAIDLNLDWLGAKKRRNLDAPYDHWPSVLDLVRKICSILPVSCKLHLQPDLSDTIQRAKELEEAGCQLLTIHGRQADADGYQIGCADWEAIRTIKAAVSVPVIANGGILESNEAQFCLEFTGVDAIMVGEGMLANPAMFAEKPMDICTLSEQYLELCAEHISSFVTHSMRGHLAHLLHRSLSKYPDIAEELSRCISFRAFHNTVTTLRQRLQDLDPAEQLGHLHPGFAQAALPAYWSYEHNMLSSIRQHRFPGDQDQVGRVLALRREQAKAGFDWDSSFHLPLRPSEIRSLDKALKVKASFMRKRQAEKSSRPVQLAACKPSVPTEQFAATPRKKAVRRGRLTAAMQPGSGALRIALDMSLSNYMSSKETHKTALQISRLYGHNMKQERPAHIFLTSSSENDVLNRLCRQKITEFDTLIMTRVAESYAEHFPREQIVFLTPDSPNALVDLSSEEVYVLGALVDERVIRNLTLDSASKWGVKTARLPITEWMDDAYEARPALAVNQVFECIMSKWHQGDWQVALEAVLPVRKKTSIDKQ